MTRTDKQRATDYGTICDAIKVFGGCREPELVAATGLSEARVSLAVRWALKLDYLTRRSEDGEINVHPAGLGAV
jgi:hypothetical protein